MRSYLALFLLVALSLSACRFISGERVDGNGIRSTEQRNVADFSGVSVSGGMDVVLVPGSYSVRIEADENLMQYIETEMDGNVLEIKPRRGYNLRTDNNITIYVGAPYFNELEVSGSGSVTSQSRIKAERRLETDISGSGDMKLDVDAPEIDMDITGSGSVLLSGATRKLRADINGSGTLKAFDLLSEETEVEISGAGDAEVYASKVLGVSVSGAGNVSYKGNPPSLNQNIAGAGNVRKAD